MKRKLYALILSGTFLLSGCNKKMPETIIQPATMVNILYDYHLASGMTLTEDNPTKRAYREYVFQKYGITEAEFDSSMVWYTRNSKQLADIYTNLSERFKKEEEHINSLLAESGTSKKAFASGDSINIWQLADIYWLSNTPINNLLRFEIKPDTSFHIKDAFVWNANYTFLSEGKATMGMNLYFDNDSIIGQTWDIAQSGEQSIELRTDSTYQLKNINGFIFLHGDSIKKPSLLINKLSLMRYHASDSTKSVKPDVKSEFQMNIHP